MKTLKSNLGVGLLSAVLLAAAGCASTGDDTLKEDLQHTKQDLQQTGAKVSVVATHVASSTASSARDAYARMQHYIAEKDVLRTFTDAGEHSETEVLAMLHRNRIATGKPAAAAGAPGAAGTSKAAAGAGAPVASSAASGAHARPLLPVDYQGSLRWPLDAGIVSSEYGARWGKMHKGIDIAADAGEPVYAAGDGQVIYAGDGLRGYGNVVIIQHDKRMTTLYAHNRELKVAQGDRITKGMLVAILGSTGHSTGPHVHFEIRRDDAAVDPRSLLPKSQLAEAGGQSAVAAAVTLARR